MIFRFLILISLLFCTVCVLTQCKNSNSKPDQFDEFKKKEKFLPDTTILYPGIGDPNMRPILTNKINQAADDFKKVYSKAKPSDDEYREIIKIGLERFRNIYLDTEDRERVAHYFEELMAIVGLKSSNGILNTFLYGFDPDKFTK